WVLKEMQEYGKQSGRKHMTNMLDALEKKAEVGGLETSEVPKLKTIENWIGCYAWQYKKDLAEKHKICLLKPYT
ncbi:35680_t:CDS:2, partial [Gigaspora margarita]